MIRSIPVTDAQDGGACFCCRRRDDGLAHFVKGRPARIVWSCRDHIHLAKKAVTMPRDEFDRYEEQALADAGDAAGAYLDGIGKTDLATLTEEEWAEFWRLGLEAFGTALEARLRSHEAPF